MNTFNKMLSPVSTLFSMLFALMARFSDNYKDLTHYIVALNQKTTPETIIEQASLCLKNILNHRLFAFAIQHSNGKVDVWLDPSMYRQSLESIIMKDFTTMDQTMINYMNLSFQSGNQEKQFKLDNLISYDLNQEDCHAKIYLLPGHTMLKYHDDMVSTILESTVVALSRQMNIVRLKQAATIDCLTGCYNRREFEFQLTRNVASAKRHKNPLSLFMLDLDNFKNINDEYGHQAGDEVLKAIAKVACENMRKEDVFARFGGEEFIAILPETDRQKAMKLADRLRKKIAQTTINTTSGPVNITASFGVDSLQSHIDISQLIENLDTMLYKAKAGGKNRVCNA